MVRAIGHRPAPASGEAPCVRVCLMIRTHALPALSYRVPPHLGRRVAPGSAVVVPLSGRSRLGVVLGPDPAPARAREDVLSVADGLSVPPDLLDACRRVGESAAVPLSTVLGYALPPGLDTNRFAVVEPAPGWPWREGEAVPRATLKKHLGPEGLREAEELGRVVLSPAIQPPRTVEWATVRGQVGPDLGRAPRQRQLFEALQGRGGTAPVAGLLAEARTGRATLRELERRGAVRLIRRPETPPLTRAAGGEPGTAFEPDASRAVGRGGAHVWRVPSHDQAVAVAAIARIVVGEGDQVLVLAPEIGKIGGLVRHLGAALPAGCSIAAYHSGLGRDREAVFEAARGGVADVVVGTRAAALLPMARPGAVCVADEHDEAHRAEPGYEGIPIHARDIAIARGRAEGSAVVCLSPTPSLRLFGARRMRGARIRELPPRPATDWPAVRIVDTRGSGAVLSPALLDACRRVPRGGGRVGVVVDRLGYASAVSCNRCGAVRRCPDCHIPLAVHGRHLVCSRCGRLETRATRCVECGSDRLSATGLAVEKVREDLASAIGGPVGLLTAARTEDEEAPVAVGTARCVLRQPWEAVLLPDVDASLQGSGIGAAERSFRMIYRAAETARALLLIQTRTPDHFVLGTAVRGDYASFAAAELPRLRAAGYPPYAHLASVVLSGRRERVFGAVESARTAVAGVEVSEPVPVAGRASWKLLLRARDRGAVVRAAGRVARLAAGTRGLEARITVDPEEV